MALDQTFSESERSARKQNSYQNAMALFELQFGKEGAVGLLTEFVEAMAVVLDDLDKCVEQKNDVQLKRLTHRVIGLCPMYDAKPTADLGQLIEDILPDGNWDAINSYNEQLRASFVAYLQES